KRSTTTRCLPNGIGQADSAGRHCKPLTERLLLRTACSRQNNTARVEAAPVRRTKSAADERSRKRRRCGLRNDTLQKN
ncbi:MAG: hypothetical protein IJ191_01740, partial [Treponema sp.]|nr:hypothetical protein [Treponema sp.]